MDVIYNVHQHLKMGVPNNASKAKKVQEVIKSVPNTLRDRINLENEKNDELTAPFLSDFSAVWRLPYPIARHVIFLNRIHTTVKSVETFNKKNRFPLLKRLL